MELGLGLAIWETVPALEQQSRCLGIPPYLL